jgi:hypothetical protein
VGVSKWIASFRRIPQDALSATLTYGSNGITFSDRLSKRNQRDTVLWQGSVTTAIMSLRTECIRIEKYGINYKLLHRKRLWLNTDGVLRTSSKYSTKIIYKENDMKNKLNQTKVLVKQVLEESEKARNSDNELYIQVCFLLNPDALNNSFIHVISNLDYYGLPPFETVRRARQKVQAERPDLRPCDEVELFRAENETAYREFATN